MCKKIIILVCLVLVSTANAIQWNIDFQGDDNHTGTYGQNGPRDYNEPGIYWNICEVQSLTAPFPGPSGYTPGPVSFELLDANGSDRGVTLTLLNDSWGWANEGTLDDLWGDYLIILNTFGVDCDPTNWEITGLTPNSQYELTYVHRANIDGRGTNFVANGVQTTVVTTMEGYMGTALVMTDSSGKISGTADSEGFSEGCWSGLIISGTGEPFYKASFPSPTDGALHADTWITLSWRPGDSAVSHDVYLGDNLEDVSNATRDSELFRSNQAETFYVAGFPGFAYPEGLVPGTMYYWRIDEVNDVNPESPCKGDIWSFSIPPKTAYNPDPADSAESVSVDVTLGWTAGWGAKLHTVYFGETFSEVDSATGGSVQGGTTYSPGSLKMAKTYYWRIDEFDVAETHKGDVWSFTTEGAVAAVNPVNGAVDVTQTPVLKWAPGFGTTHEVYFGTDVASLELKGSGNLGEETFEPGQLEWNTTYYWRVDEVNNANADSPWTGPLWSFTTANFLIIDDMESYNDINEGEPGSNRIYLAWVDGYDNPAVNGSVVGNDPPPIAEQNIVHSGLQSMPMAYDNAVGKSEATLTLTDKRDWTVNGVDTLTVWFRGTSGNAAEQMYVALNGNVRVDHDNPDAALATDWTEWNIPLQAFADQGVNLSNVNSITLGLSSVTGGTGKMYFDDIRLYPPAPLL